MIRFEKMTSIQAMSKYTCIFKTDVNKFYYAIWQLNMLLIGSVIVKLIGSSSHPKFYEWWYSYSSDKQCLDFHIMCLVLHQVVHSNYYYYIVLLKLICLSCGFFFKCKNGEIIDNCLKSNCVMIQFVYGTIYFGIP